MAASIRPFRGVLLDIEGTIAPLSFVHEVLFPYAREHLPRFLHDRWQDPAVRQDVALVQAEQRAELDAGRPDALPLPPAGAPESEARAATLTYLLALMARDSKATGLKNLPGRVWRAGYEAGTLRSELFEDVPPALERWHAAGKPAAIYSSGSVEAQRLLLRHSTAGDLTPLVAAYFDTTTGPKREAASYAAIARALGLPAADVLFATDVLDEAQAAAAAGLQPVLLDRPGNRPQPPHGFPVLTHFTGL